MQTFFTALQSLTLTERQPTLGAYHFHLSAGLLFTCLCKAEMVQTDGEVIHVHWAL